jgi:aminopeptidase N
VNEGFATYMAAAYGEQRFGRDTYLKDVASYTSEHFARSVRTGDFQAAMEKASGRDLRTFFDRWVYQ